MLGANKQIKQRLRKLEGHLRNENPLLVEAVKGFRKLDKVAYRMGLLEPDQSYATQIPWWPLISVLGTFSAGKSTFINHYLQYDLQETGTQAVDEKFTVMCYSNDKQHRVLPGIALDADPRFPFYQMADEIEKVAPGEGGRVDAYLQMKTCPSDQLRGTIIIDSPGFDADAQRTSTLRITDYMINLSDLVLVFFDARHPEPGAMRDTLQHLVADKIYDKNATKFVYILNQIDATVREDNPEDVVAAWQRALAGEGLTAGKFYTIYNPDAAAPIEDDNVRQRYEKKRDADLADIHERMKQMHIDRVYRIVGALDKTAREIEQERVPKLKSLLTQWRWGVVWRDLGMAVALLVLFIGATAAAGFWQGMNFVPHWPNFVQPVVDWLLGNRLGQIIGVAGIVFVLAAIHHLGRIGSAKRVIEHFRRLEPPTEAQDNIINAFRKNTRPWHSVFRPEPVAWGRRTQKILRSLVAEADQFIQTMNDRFAKPSGESEVGISADKPLADAEQQTPQAVTEQLADENQKTEKSETV